MPGRVDEDDALGCGFQDARAVSWLKPERGFREPCVVLQPLLGPLMLGGGGLQLGHAAAQSVDSVSSDARVSDCRSRP